MSALISNRAFKMRFRLVFAVSEERRGVGSMIGDHSQITYDVYRSLGHLPFVFTASYSRERFMIPLVPIRKAREWHVVGAKPLAQRNQFGCHCTASFWSEK